MDDLTFEMGEAVLANGKAGVVAGLCVMEAPDGSEIEGVLVRFRGRGGPSDWFPAEAVVSRAEAHAEAA